MPISYYEELTATHEGGKMLGTRTVPCLPPGRKAGYGDRQEIHLTEPTVLMKGYRQVSVRASVEKPVPAWSVFYENAKREDSIMDRLDKTQRLSLREQIIARKDAQVNRRHGHAVN